MSYKLPYKLNVIFRHEGEYTPPLPSEIIFGIPPTTTPPIIPPIIPPITPIGGGTRPTVKTIIEDATGNTTSTELNTPRIRQFKGGAIPYQISGITSATVYFEGTLVNNASEIPTATWSKIEDTTHTTDVCNGIFVMYPYIRAKIINYVSGTITVKVEV